MDASTEARYDTGSKFYDLPNDVLLCVFSKSNLKDLLNFKKACRKFYKLIDDNYIRMSKTVAFEMSITRSPLDDDKISFDLDVCYVSHNKNNRSSNGKYFKRGIKGEEEFSKTLKIFVTKSLYRLVVRNCDNINVFNVLHKHYQQESSIEILYIDKLGENDIQPFQQFVNQLENVKMLEVLQIFSSIEACKTKPSLIFPSLTSLECVNLTECQETNFLNHKLIVELFENNPNIRDLRLSSKNIHFMESVLVWFFFRQQLTTSRTCNHNKISLCLDNISTYKEKLIRTLDTTIRYLRGILGYEILTTFKGHTKYEIVKKCFHCNEKSIDIHVTLINSTTKL
uniref:F-box domain-containing protein n=1 Tax=Strongyloides papillosus TaxID=174720 RepID=A0A0N5B5D2_STREA